MMGTTHRTGSIALACGVIALCPVDKVGIAPAATFMVASAIGGLFPDADTPYSTYGRRFFIVLWPFYLLRRVISLIGRFNKAFKEMGKALGHRGMFHSPVLWTILLAVMLAVFKGLGVTSMIVYAIALGMYTGAISHVLLDFISGGVPLLAPFSLKRFTPPIRFKTGSIFEVIFNVAFVVIAIVCAYYALPKLI